MDKLGRTKPDLQPQGPCPVHVQNQTSSGPGGFSIDESLDLRGKKGFSLEGKDNQQKTYDNETGECTSGQGPIFIQNWQAHLGNKGYEPDKRIGDVGVCAQACKGGTK